MANSVANAEVNEYLAQCNGFETSYRHSLTGLVYSEGVKFLAEKCGAYWLIDACLTNAKFKRTEEATEGFEVWRLKRNKTGSGALLTCDDGNDGSKPVASQKIPYTDFPFGDSGELKLYRENGILYLPEER